MGFGQGSKQLLLASRVVQSDDTGITVIDSSTSQGSRHSYLSVYVHDRDEVVFDFTIGRRREGPTVFLSDYRGRLQVDAYSGYDQVIRQNDLIAVGCWAHARRRFHEALESEPDAKNAMEVIRRMDRVEQDARDRSLDPDQRRELRQSESRPLLDAMHPWLEGIRHRHLPKSPMGDAIGYALRRWNTLLRYLDDGRLDIDNNRVERQMRSVAVGRKNWMFAGSAAGARRAATIYSLVNSCGLLGIEPWAYLKDVLQRIAEGADASTLTPRLWKSAAGRAAVG